MSRLPVARTTMTIDGVDVEMGPAMQALPADRMRLFVYHYCWNTKRGHGSVTEASRLAGYGKPTSTPQAIGSAGWHLVKREDVQRAIAEQIPKMITAHGVDAVKAAVDLVNNPGHKHHWSATNAILERVAPTTTLIHHKVEKVADPESEALELYRAMRAQGYDRAALEKTFGAIGIDRYERLLAKEGGTASQRMREAIDVTPTEVDEDW